MRGVSPRPLPPTGLRRIWGARATECCGLGPPSSLQRDGAGAAARAGAARRRGGEELAPLRADVLEPGSVTPSPGVAICSKQSLLPACPHCRRQPPHGSLRLVLARWHSTESTSARPTAPRSCESCHSGSPLGAAAYSWCAGGHRRGRGRGGLRAAGPGRRRGELCRCPCGHPCHSCCRQWWGLALPPCLAASLPPDARPSP